MKHVSPFVQNQSLKLSNVLEVPKLVTEDFIFNPRILFVISIHGSLLTNGGICVYHNLQILLFWSDIFLIPEMQYDFKK